MPYLRTIDRQRAEVSCPHCQTTFTVDRDEDGGAELETWPCQADDHTHRLCEECKFTCCSCDCTFCRESLTETIDGLMCKLCLDAMAAEGGKELESGHAA